MPAGRLFSSTAQMACSKCSKNKTLVKAIFGGIFLYFLSHYFFFLSYRELEAEYNRLKGIRPSASDDGSQSGNDSARDAELLAEAEVLRQHKGRLEARMQILEDHNKQLEAQLQRLRQLLEQVGYCRILILSWPKSLSYRTKSVDLQSKSMDWFLYDSDLRHERVKYWKL